MRVTLFCLAVIVFSGLAFADTGVVTVSGSGIDAQDATANLLRNSTVKYVKLDSARNKAILQNEILSNASSFVQSYRIAEGSKQGKVTITANLDLDVLNGIFALTPNGLAETEGAKALVFVRGMKLAEPTKTPTDPFLVLDVVTKERFQRRGFELVSLDSAATSEVDMNEDVTSLEVLKGLTAKYGARIAVGIAAKMEKIENEHAHAAEERVVLYASMIDSKTGTILSKSTVSFPNPKTHKDPYYYDLKQNLIEESRDLLQDLFVGAGKKIVGTGSSENYSIVRVKFPSNPNLTAKFKTSLEGLKGVKAVVEHQVRRGSFDFAVSPKIETVALVKGIKSLVSEEILIEVTADDRSYDENEAQAQASVKLAPKAPKEEVKNEVVN